MRLATQLQSTPTVVKYIYTAQCIVIVPVYVFVCLWVRLTTAFASPLSAFSFLCYYNSVISICAEEPGIEALACACVLRLRLYYV